jgi:hypothetical protein
LEYEKQDMKCSARQPGVLVANQQAVIAFFMALTNKGLRFNELKSEVLNCITDAWVCGFYYE